MSDIDRIREVLAEVRGRITDPRDRWNIGFTDDDNMDLVVVDEEGNHVCLVYDPADSYMAASTVAEHIADEHNVLPRLVRMLEVALEGLAYFTGYDWQDERDMMKAAEALKRIAAIASGEDVDAQSV